VIAESNRIYLSYDRQEEAIAQKVFGCFKGNSENIVRFGLRMFYCTDQLSTNQEQYRYARQNDCSTRWAKPRKLFDIDISILNPNIQ